jgi:hypothetical protein
LRFHALSVLRNPRWIIERLFGWDQMREGENFAQFSRHDEVRIITADEQGQDVANASQVRKELRAEGRLVEVNSSMSATDGQHGSFESLWRPAKR